MDELLCPGCESENIIEVGWDDGLYWMRCLDCEMQFDVINEYGQPLRLPEDARADQEARAEMEAEEKTMNEADVSKKADVSEKVRSETQAGWRAMNQVDDVLKQIAQDHPLNVTLADAVMDAQAALTQLMVAVENVEGVINDESIIY